MEQIRLDLIPDGSRPVCHASQYDDGRVIRINLTENGADYTLSNETVELHVRKGDGTAVTCAVAIESGKKYVDIVTTTQMCAVYGSNLAELQITKNGVIIGTLNFILEVERDPLDSGISSSSQIHDLQAQVDACVQHTFDTLGASGLPFDHTGTDLTSDNVEDAIKEVNDKIGGLPADVYTKEETDALLDEKADKTTLTSDYYNKTEVDTALSEKADTSALGNYYTKSEDDALLAGKADKSTTYTKSQVNGLLDDKADRSDLDDYYTSAQVDAALTAKADKDNVYTKTQVDSALSGKADNSALDNYYDKNHSYSSSEVNGLLDLKADKATTYTKTQVDSALALKANSADVYNKSAVDSLLNGKADKSTTYTKTEVDNALALKANSADVYTKTQTYSKTEVDNALTLKANAADVYTKQETDNLIAGILPLKTFSPTPIATLTDGAENVPMKSLVCEIVPKETGTGTKSPSNPYTISGWDSIPVTHTGKNLLAKSFIYNDNADLDSLSECFFIKKGSYIASFGSMTNATSWRFIIRLKDASGNDLSTSDYITFNSSMSWSTTRKAWINNANTTSYSCIFTVNQDCYIRVLFGVGNTSASSVASNAQLEIGSIKTAYEPYTATTETIALPRTIYGGEDDVVSGSGNDTQVKIIFDGSSDEYWSAYLSRNGFYINIPDMKTSNGEIGYSCNYLKVTSNWEENLGIRYGANNKFIYCLHITDKLQDVTDVATWRTYLSNNPLVLTYPLATPTPITTTPIQIKTRGGTESIFADCGEVSGEYRQSIQGYVAEQLNGNRGLSKGPVEETKEEEPEEKPEER